MADLITITVDSSDVVKATQYTNELTAANDRLEKELEPLLAKEKEFQRAIRQVNEAMRLNVITNKQAIAQVQALGKQYGYTQQQIDRATASMTGIRKNTNRMNATIQNAGYQFGDFFVQVQSGQNVLVAFSQQGAQLAGLMPGLAGAVTGVALVIGSMLVRALMEGSSFFKGMKSSIEDAREAIKSFEQSSSRLAKALEDDLPAAAIRAFKVFEEANLAGAIEKTELSLTKTLNKTEKNLDSLKREAKKAAEDLKGALVAVELGYQSRGFAQIEEKLKKALDLTVEVRDLEQVEALFRKIDSVDFDDAEQISSIMETIAERAKFLKDQNKISAEVFAELEGLVNDLGDRLDSLPDAVSETTSELEAQKIHLEAILKMEQARDRLAGSIEQKFAASTRKLELMRGGMGAGLAGSQVSMEQQIAELVAAERLLVQASAGDTGMTSQDVSRHMQDFENNLRTRLQGYLQEQAAIKELSSVRTASSEAALTEEERLQKRINETLNSREKQMKMELSLLDLSKEEAEITKFIYELEKSLGVERGSLSAEQEEQFARIIALKEEYIQKTLEQKAAEEKLKKEVEAYNKVKQKANDIASTMASETVGALKSIVNGTKTASEAFRDMALNIIQQIMDILIWQPLIQSITNSLSGAIMGGVPVPGQRGGGGFSLTSMIGGLFGGGATLPAVYAKGGVFSAGNIVPFANGGIVGSPTMFGMSGGRTGLMGEAGPEAIMPLKRGPDGKLGVEGGGNVTVNQTFNFAANGDDSVKKIIAEAAPKIAKMTEAQIINSRQRGGQMRRAFG